MAVKTEANYCGDWLKFEEENLFSREEMTVSSGNNLVSGQVVKDAAGEVVPITAAADTPVGILLFDTDATAADKKAPVIVRDAIVNPDFVTFFGGISAPDKATVIGKLKTLRILSRTGA